MTSSERKILVVEDENIVALDIKSHLLDLGYEVTDTVPTGRKALVSVERRRPDLVLMDVRLHGDMDGIETAEQMRRFDIPVVYVTAFSDETTLKRANISEPFGYLLKPFDERELQIVVEMAIYRHRSQKEHEQLLQEMAARAAIEKEHRWTQFLADAGRELSSSLDIQTTLDTIARLAVPALADWAMVNARGENGFETVAVRHAAGKVDLVLEILRRYPPAPNLPHGFPHVIETGKSELITEITDDILQRSAADEDNLRLLRAVGLKSHICVPMSIRARPWGALTLASAESARRYGSDDLAHAEELAQRCAMAVDNARLYGEAKQAIGLRDEFLSVASHELRTPLAALQLTIQRLQRALDRSNLENIRQSLAKANRQVERLADLTEKLLDVSRIGSGKLQLAFEHVDLVPLVDEVVERLSSTAQEAGSSILVTAPQEWVIPCDRVRIEQVVSNLLSNAIKFGEGKPIELVLEGNPDVTRIIVRDRGIGIAPKKICRIFDRFERAVSGHLYTGLGLGLYIARQIVETHGGSIHVESELGAGSTFVVALPKTSVAER